MYDATQCTDVQWPQSFAQWRKDNNRVAKIAPFETWANAWYNAPCLYWPGQVHTPVKVDGSKVKSVLMIDETLDAATPYSGSLVVRKLFPGASLIALPGRHLARQLAVRRRVRGRPDRGLPGPRHAPDPQAREPGGHDLQTAAGAGPDRRRRLGAGQVGDGWCAHPGRPAAADRPSVAAAGHRPGGPSSGSIGRMTDHSAQDATHEQHDQHDQQGPARGRHSRCARHRRAQRLLAS